MLRLQPATLLLIPVLTLLPALTVAACAGESAVDEPEGCLTQEIISRRDTPFVTYAPPSARFINRGRRP